MNGRSMEDNFSDGITCESSELVEWLKQYPIVPPTDAEIDATVEHVLFTLATHKPVGPRAIGFVRSLMRSMLFQIEYVPLSYWLLSLLVFGCGVVGIALGVANPYVTALYLSPLPFVLGLRVVVQNGERGVSEMELACKFSGTHYIVAKFFVLSLFNFVLILSLLGITEVYYPSVIFPKLMNLCLVPSVLLASVAFVVSTSSRTPYALLSIVVLWTALSAGCLQNAQLVSDVVIATQTTRTPILAVSAFVVIVQFIRMKRRMVRVVTD